jgi:hypothetical protein
VDDDLIPLARGAGIDAVVERRLGEQSQRVSLLLTQRRRVLGDDQTRRRDGPCDPRSRGNVFRLSIQRLAGCGQRLHQDRAGLRLEPPPDHHHAVFVLIHMQGSAPMTPGGLLCFCLPIHPAPATDDPLDVLGGARPADREQPLLGLRRGHAG